MIVLLRSKPLPFSGSSPIAKQSSAGLSEIYRGGKSGRSSDGYYDVRDQRFLGDERFVEEIEERIQEDREIARPVPRAKLSALLPLVAKAYDATEKELVRAGRQRPLGKSEINVGVLRTGVGEGECKGAWKAAAS